MSSTDNSIFPHTHSRTQWDIGISNWMFIVVLWKFKIEFIDLSSSTLHTSTHPIFSDHKMCVRNMPKHSMCNAGSSHILREILFWIQFRYLFHPNLPYILPDWVKEASLPLNRQQHFNYIPIWCDWYFLGVVDLNRLHVKAKSQSQSSHHLVEMCGWDNTEKNPKRNAVKQFRFCYCMHTSHAEFLNYY